MDRRRIPQVIYWNLPTKLATFLMNKQKRCISKILDNANLVTRWRQLGWQKYEERWESFIFP